MKDLTLANEIRQKYEEQFGKRKEKELAEYLGISKTSLSLLLNGERAITTYEFFSICCYLNIQPSYFTEHNFDNQLFTFKQSDNTLINNHDIRNVWKKIRTNNFPSDKQTHISINKIAEQLDKSTNFVIYRDYDYRPKQKIYLDEFVKLCEIYNISIDNILYHLLQMNTTV